MADLQASRFREFFQELHKKPPFPWQEALAERVCAGKWPEVIHLPTASGKTACLDIALFALAVRGSDAARRIFFVVDRRVVVNEAYLRMLKIRDALKEAKGGVLYEVAGKLRGLAGDKDEDPLLVSEMRGGAYRDETWVKNPLQPTVVASTVDQVGSRLLFRGYGVNQNFWPLHAGLIGNDALIFLDEAHCSRAFAQTLKRVEKYRGVAWASESLPEQLPFCFVEMTATPSQEVRPDQIFKLTEKDREVDALRKRLQAAKPTRLIDEIKGRKDDTAKIAEKLVEQAVKLAKDANAQRVAIFANRVKTAKDAYRQLRQRFEGSETHVKLVIGSMRAVDRDDLYNETLKSLKSGSKREGPLTLVVSTQCLEVGADFDFDVLVSECASIDALQQRFGRLDRLGKFERAQGAIVIGSWQADLKQPDAVYGNALAKTWKWLKQLAAESDAESDIVNMGIEHREGAPHTVNEHLDKLDSETAKGLRLIGEDAPVLLPTHVDMLAQTSPVPEPSPLVELLLHGPKRGVPDVQVVWRSDLEEARTLEEEIEIIGLCPPSTRETMSVSINAFRRWFAGEQDVNENESDLEIGLEEKVPERWQKNRHALVWDGDRSSRIWNAKQVRPGQTLILKESMGGWDKLGYIPKDTPVDVGDRAAFETRSSVSLRLHPELTKLWPESPALRSLVEDLRQPDFGATHAKRRLQTCRDELKEEIETEQDKKWDLWPYKLFRDRELEGLERSQLNRYPKREDSCVLQTRRAADKKKSNGEQVSLEKHLAHVEAKVGKMASGVPAKFYDALRTSARLHDYGKADARFQAWLRGGDLMVTRFAPVLLAKSGQAVLPKQATVGLPDGFRHELLSLMFAEKSPEASGEMRELILHLVAAHHGRCRPFAPVVLDDNAECASFGKISLCKEERIQNAPHRLDSGVADRFWRLTAKYGWWGLAYLEALLRLADWQASEEECAEVSD